MAPAATAVTTRRPDPSRARVRREEVAEGRGRPSQSGPPGARQNAWRAPGLPPPHRVSLYRGPFPAASRAASAAARSASWLARQVPAGWVHAFCVKWREGGE
jgi:hypothetical protein